MTQIPPASPNINLTDAETILCEKCGNCTFQQVVILKRISRLVHPTPNGKDSIAPVPVFACNSCGYINSMFAEMLFGSAVTEKNSEDSATESKPTLKLVN